MLHQTSLDFFLSRLSRFRTTHTGNFIGIVLFGLSFITLFLNDSRIDYTSLLKDAPLLKSTQEIPTKYNNTLVIIQGNLSTQTGMGDIYLKSQPLISLTRKVEIYSWSEHITFQKKIEGGTESTDQTYIYKKGWTETPENSAKYKILDGHKNTSLEVKSIRKMNTHISLGKYQIDNLNLTLPMEDFIEANKDNINAPENGYFTGGYLYITKNGGTLRNPEIGDIRISYTGIFSPKNNIFLVGKYSPSQKKISAYSLSPFDSLYRVFEGNRESILEELSSNYVFSYWILRVVGFFMMSFGFYFVSSPIFSTFNILSPLSKKVSSTPYIISCFIYAFILSLFVILISSLFKNIFILLGALVFAYLGIKFTIKKFYFKTSVR